MAEVIDIEEVYVHEFKKPFTYGGKTYEKLTFNWGGLTGSDTLEVENEMQQLGKFVALPEYSTEYLMRIALRASGDDIGYGFIEALPLKEFTKIKNEIKNFIKSSD